MNKGNSKASGPDLSKYMDKTVNLKLNANREISGVLCGFDDFMNLVLDNTYILKNGKNTGVNVGKTVVRGDSIIMIESTEPIASTNYAPKVR